MRGSKNSLRATDAQIQAQGVGRGAHLTLSVGERSWKSFPSLTPSTRMELQRSSDGQHFSKIKSGLCFTNNTKTLVMQMDT